MENYRKDLLDYMKEVCRTKESITDFLKKIGVYDKEGNITENYGGKRKQ